MTSIGHPLQSAASAHTRRDLRQQKATKILKDPKETLLWSYYDHVEGISSYVNVLSNSADLVTYYPATAANPEPTEIDNGKVFDAWEGLGGEAWFSTLMAELVKHMSVPGQAWMVPTDDNGLAAREAGLDDMSWSVWSTQEVRKALDLPPEGQIPSQDNRLWRIWMPHPQEGIRPDSAVRRVEDKAEILTLIDKRRKADLNSGLFAGVLPIPARLKNETTESGKTWDDLFEELLIEPIGNHESPASIVPLMVFVEPEEAEVLRGGPIKMSVDDPQRLHDLEERTLRRLAIGIDAPVELITGMADLNHWTAWLIRQETYEQHLDPLIVRILRSLNPWWQAHLTALGIPAEGMVLWRNPATAINQPGVFDSALQLHDRFVISDEALLDAADRSDEDAPDDEELTRRILQKALASPLALSAVPAVAEQAGEIVGIPASENPAESDEPPAEAVEPIIQAAIEAALSAIQAASPSDLQRVARRLSNIDGETLTRMEKEATGQMKRLRRQVTDRIAAAVKRQGQEVGDPDTLPRRLGQPAVEALVDGELVEAEDFDPAPFDRIISTAQADTGQATASVGAQRDSEADDNDRGQALTVLLAGLAAALLSGLYRTRQPRGEEGIDGSELVPFDQLRHALDIAGGGPAARVSADEAWELIGNGKRSVDSLAAAGIVTEGFRWVYGTMPRQTFKPHLDIDGEQFVRWDDPVLRQTEETWVGGEYWFPGDHRGCRCRYERTLIEQGA